ncbi:MAG: hypothetical protein NTX04_06140, partial [Verrucomicrobia bacterium]|nr:hypothetical protein [Verrucomicrobiota bacterium]
QPGLIRTFDSLGKPAKSYKLYSADSLVEEGSFNPALATDLPPASGPTSWKSQPALYTDLNAPIADLNRTDPFDPTKKLLVYPIFDGNHLNSAGQFSLNKDANADIEGFTVDEFSTRGVSMPLKWLYILKDGTLATAKASGSAGDIQIIVPPGKEKTPQGEPNLPTARIAFWTDDETTKLNLNTGSEGTFWDTATANSQPGVKNPAVGSNYTSSNDTVFEWDLAERMGAQKEYNRYPGHPATTCLSTVFGRQLLLTQQVGGSRQAMIEEINKFIPRVSGGEYDPTDTFYENKLRDNSSQGGSVRAGSSSGDSGVNIVTPDNDRLYASIDEFLYNPNFAATGTTRPMWRLAPPVSKRDTTREMLEMAKFFLTTPAKPPNKPSPISPASPSGPNNSPKPAAPPSINSSPSAPRSAPNPPPPPSPSIPPAPTPIARPPTSPHAISPSSPTSKISPVAPSPVGMPPPPPPNLSPPNIPTAIATKSSPKSSTTSAAPISPIPPTPQSTPPSPKPDPQAPPPISPAIPPPASPLSAKSSLSKCPTAPVASVASPPSPNSAS